jgi:RNA polymerase sigma-70 factor (ECF subfamily)
METTLAPAIDTQAEDLALIQGIINRDPKALADLDARYRGILRSIVLQVIHDSAETEDVLQEVLLQIWDRAASYSAHKGKLVSWLCTLARRRAIDRLRQQSAYRRATDRFEVSLNHANQSFEDTHLVEVEACRGDLKDLLERHLKLLPPNQEQVVRLAFFENRSQREISVLTNTPLGTVKTRIELGIRKLSHALGGLRGKIA